MSATRLGQRGGGPALCGSALVLDTIVLTALVRDSGGPANAFSVLYLVGVSLSAVVLGARWTWVLTLLAIAGYGSLFVGTSVLRVPGCDNMPQTGRRGTRVD